MCKMRRGFADHVQAATSMALKTSFDQVEDYLKQ